MEVCFPDAAIASDPSVEFLQRRWAQGVDATLSVDARVDEACIREDAEMLGNLGLIEVKLVDEVANRARAVEEEFDDVEAVGFGEGFEGLEHGTVNMLT